MSGTNTTCTGTRKVLRNPVYGQALKAYILAMNKEFFIRTSTFSSGTNLVQRGVSLSKGIFYVKACR